MECNCNIPGESPLSALRTGREASIFAKMTKMSEDGERREERVAVCEKILVLQAHGAYSKQK